MSSIEITDEDNSEKRGSILSTWKISLIHVGAGVWLSPVVAVVEAAESDGAADEVLPLVLVVTWVRSAETIWKGWKGTFPESVDDSLLSLWLQWLYLNQSLDSQNYERGII